MTVAELIEKLKGLPQDAKVICGETPSSDCLLYATDAEVEADDDHGFKDCVSIYGS